MRKTTTAKRAAALLIEDALQNAHYLIESYIDGDGNEANIREIHEFIEKISAPMLDRLERIYGEVDRDDVTEFVA